MKDPIEPRAPSLVLKLEVQPPSAVWGDTKRNRWWIIGMLISIFFFLFFSAYIATLFDRGFMVPGSDFTKGGSTLTYGTAIYFTVINMTTVGFGDIYPITEGARWLTAINAIFGLITFAALVSIIMMALSPSSDPLLVKGGSASSSFHEANSEPEGVNTEAVRSQVDATRDVREALEGMLYRVSDILKGDEILADKPWHQAEREEARRENLLKGLLSLVHDVKHRIDVARNYEAVLSEIYRMDHEVRRQHRKPKAKI